MEKSKYFLSIDLGSEYIKLLIFEKEQNSKEVKPVKHIFRKIAESDLNNNHPIRCIKKSLKEALDDFNLPELNEIYVSINNENIVSQTIHNELNFIEEHAIDENDLQELTEESFNSIGKNNELIYLRTNKYTIDNKIDVTNPLLMEAKKLKVENFIVKIEEKYLDQIDEILDYSSIRANSIIPGIVAQGEALLNNLDKNYGTLILDLGYKTCDVILYENGNIVLCFTLNIGTSDYIDTLSHIFHLKYSDAYYIFKENVNLNDIESEKPISYIDIYGSKRVISSNILNKIIEDLIRQTYLNILNIFERKSHKINSVILSGGISNIQGIKQITSKVFNTNKVRIGKINDKLTGLSDNKWATCFGMMYISSNEEKTKKNDIYNIIYNIKLFIDKILK